MANSLILASFKWYLLKTDCEEVNKIVYFICYIFLIQFLIKNSYLENPLNLGKRILEIGGLWYLSPYFSESLRRRI